MRDSSTVKVLLVFACLVLIGSVRFLIHYLVDSHAVRREPMTVVNNMNRGNFSDDNNPSDVPMPLNTPYTCHNMCGPLGQCARTRESCLSDSDCTGCQRIEVFRDEEVRNTPNNNNSQALKALPVQLRPMESVSSSLVNAFGAEGYEEVNHHGNRKQKKSSSEPIVIFRDTKTDTWSDTFRREQALFDQHFRPQNVPFMPSYAYRTTLTGAFREDGPFPANT